MPSLNYTRRKQLPRRFLFLFRWNVGELRVWRLTSFYDGLQTLGQEGIILFIFELGKIFRLQRRTVFLRLSFQVPHVSSPSTENKYHFFKIKLKVNFNLLLISKLSLVKTGCFTSFNQKQNNSLKVEIDTIVRQENECRSYF